MSRDFHLQSLEKSWAHDVESSRHGEPASTAVVQLYGFRFFMLSVFIAFRFLLNFIHVYSYTITYTAAIYSMYTRDVPENRTRPRRPSIWRRGEFEHRLGSASHILQTFGRMHRLANPKRKAPKNKKKTFQQGLARFFPGYPAKNRKLKKQKALISRHSEPRSATKRNLEI